MARARRRFVVKSYGVPEGLLTQLLVLLFHQQKWSKGRAREKLVNAVLFDKKTFDRLLKEVPKVC